MLTSKKRVRNTSAIIFRASNKKRRRDNVLYLVSAFLSIYRGTFPLLQSSVFCLDHHCAIKTPPQPADYHQQNNTQNYIWGAVEGLDRLPYCINSLASARKSNQCNSQKRTYIKCGNYPGPSRQPGRACRNLVIFLQDVVTYTRNQIDTAPKTEARIPTLELKISLPRK